MTTLPRPLTIRDRIYLRARYRVTDEELNDWERLGCDRAEVFRLLESRGRAALWPDRPQRRSETVADSG